MEEVSPLSTAVSPDAVEDSVNVRKARRGDSGTSMSVRILDGAGVCSEDEGDSAIACRLLPATGARVSELLAMDKL